MKPVTVDPTAVSTVSAGHRRAADVVAEHAASEAFDAAALLPTFGVIGAGFVAGLADVAAERGRRLQTLAAAHRATAGTVDAADESYRCCDADGARAVSA